MGVAVAWGLAGLAFLYFYYWRRRGWRLPLGAMWLGLVAAAAVAGTLTAAQLIPVIEFIQQTTRAAAGWASRHLSLQRRAVPAGRADLAQYRGHPVWREQLLVRGDPATGRVSQDLGAVALPGRDDRHSGRRCTGGAEGTTVAGVAVGDRGGQLASAAWGSTRARSGRRGRPSPCRIRPSSSAWPPSLVRSTPSTIRRSGKTAFSRTATAVSTGGWRRFCRASGSFGSRESYSPYVAGSGCAWPASGGTGSAPA